MEELFEFLVFAAVIVLALYSGKKKRLEKMEELKKAQAERERRANAMKNQPKPSSNDIVRRRKENERAAEEIKKRRLENDKAAADINNRRVEQQKAADASRIHTSIHEKEETEERIVPSVTNASAEDHELEKFDFETSDLMKEVEDLMAYGYDGSEFLRRLEKENRFQSSFDATINT